MKSRYFLTFSLAATLMAPAFAQQSGSTPNTDSTSAQAPAAATSQQTADDASLSARQPLQPETHEGFWGHLNPFARKKFVHRQLQPVRDRVNELDELTAANGKMIRDVDSRSTEGIRLASVKANEADAHAVDAGNRAQAANQLAQQTTTRLGTVEQTVNNLDQYQAVSDTEIRFRPGQSVLSARAKEALDQLAEPLKSQRGYIVEVQGFSSGKGPASIESSRAMAESVVRYLVINHEVPVYRIYTVGMGNAAAKPASDGSKPKRTLGGRVEISLLHNGIADMTQTAQSSPAASQSDSQASPVSSGATQGGVSGAAASSTSLQQQPKAITGNAQPAASTSPVSPSTVPQPPRN
jgi:outer membrane protein OmpA-like peptidoglycan-associated protein